MGKGRDSTVLRFFVPVPLVPWNNHVWQSRKIFPVPARPADFCPGPGPTGHKKRRDRSGQSRESRSYESRFRSWGFAGRDRDPDIFPGEPPIPDLWNLSRELRTPDSRALYGGFNTCSGKLTIVPGLRFPVFQKYSISENFEKNPQSRTPEKS